MKKNNYYKTCEIESKNIREKFTKEFFNDYGYNISTSRLNKLNNYENYAKTNQNDIKKR